MALAIGMEIKKLALEPEGFCSLLGK
uniref:Uncharacterized protein n=1 Tax=Rhizophora mucronata TaxID=61149 RepID=A0A2P2Q9K8_RHIMU